MASRVAPATPHRNPWQPQSEVRDQRDECGPAAVRVQRYGEVGQLRANQGYLTKMPAEWVRRWPQLTAMADALSRVQDVVATSDDAPQPAPSSSAVAQPVFKTKNEADYLAVIRASIQKRTRSHERLVRQTGEWFRQRGAAVSMPHPRDMLITEPLCVLIEAKIVGEKSPVFAVREAVGQLLEYGFSSDRQMRCFAFF
jgi:hypothetical protein